MFLLVISLYFLLVCGIVWLLLFPVAREIICAVLRNKWERLWKLASSWMARRVTSTNTLPKRLLATSAKTSRYLQQHRLIFLIVAAVIIFPPLAAWLFSGKNMVVSYEESRLDVNTQIADLLKGEQLVPPPPLPPDIFSTQEVTQLRPMLATASRNWQALDADFTQRLLLTFKIMREKHDYEMVIIEGYRSPERQNSLAKMGTNVTNAKAFQSYHQYGLAADSAFMRNGKLLISEKDPWAMRGYQLYGEVAESVGLHWGGRWKMMDFGHVELRKPGVIGK
ncbi:M15 family metallopeptidase [Herbaspirillum sp. RTI4]|uniref:M15 family metallopeptidase n=1 Tax=Herbaspirillum sp. RTI4 TaxID=3048640 RepID=UPI002AB32D83|nr:M15 family metallopeptidase [Herbaspirillum sp. RTI4]MDY7579038.1 M15 family metallopeptidase [Herbaspirillum sp. RTI4]MEA9982377.1 M15 family metallopeptidase [Herbaspirillum sp. RTI4]